MENRSTQQNTRNFFFGFNTTNLKIFLSLLMALFFGVSAADAQAPKIAYSTPQVYNSGVAIPPLSPTNTGGAVAFSAPVSVSGYSDIAAVAIGASGSVYIAAYPDIIKNGAILVSGVNAISLAVDASGNLYFCKANHKIYKLAPGSTSPTTAVSTGTPSAVALDAAGNLYFTEDGAGDVRELPAGSNTSVVIATGFSYPAGLTLDAAGNIYVADANNYAIKKILAGSGKIVTLCGTTPGGFLNSVAVDALGNVYFAKLDQTTVTEIPADGGSNIIIASNLYNPYSLATDNFGHLYVGNAATNPNGYHDNGIQGLVEIGTAGYKISPALPTGLHFNTTTGVISGTPTTITPAANYTVTAANQYGTATAVINITVNTPAKPIISYSSPQTYTVPQGAITPIAPVSSGGPVSAFSVSPALPSGLNFDNTTGIISGTPQTASASANYTVTATNGGGSATATINLTVNIIANALGFSYSSPQVYNPLIPVTPLAPQNAGAIPGPYPVTLGTLAIGITGMAVDSSGSIYIVGTNSTSVTKLSGGTFTTIGSTLSHPTGVAVDAAGNLFIADYGHNNIKEFPAGSKNVVNYLFTITGPQGIAVDAADNLYVTGANGIYKIPAGSKTPKLIMGNVATGIAVDAAGDVYWCYTAGNTIYEIVASTGQNILIATGLSSPPVGVAVDGAGNIYYSQANSVIMELPKNGAAAFPAISGLSNAAAVTVDNKGGIFTESGGNAIVGIPFGVYSIAPSLPPGLTFNKETGIISGTPTAVTPAANYTVTGSNLGGSGVTTVNITVSATAKPNISYSTPQTFYVGTPVSASPANTGAAVPLQQPLTLASGLQYEQAGGITVDGAGNIYTAFSNNTSIFRYPPGGGTPTLLGFGFNHPTSLAMDAAGNIFLTDGGSRSVQEISAANGSVVTYANGFGNPEGIGIDAAGNLYVSDQSKNTIFKIPAGGGTPVALITGNGLNGPTSIAVDGAGDVFIANTTGNNVKELPAGSSSLVSLASGFNAPYSVAVDPAGNVFVADEGNAAIKRIPAGGGAPAAVAQAIPLKQPGAVALDANGNIYIADWTTQSMYEINPGYYINPTLPAGLSIDQNTGIISGTPTIKSPKTNYTISTRNSGGVSVATIEITVNPAQKPTVAYNTPQVYAVNDAIAPLTPKSSIVSPASYTRSATTFASSLSGNQGVAADVAGNVYAAETTGNAVIKITPGGVVTPLGSGFNYPTAVALDAANNVYVADYGNHAVKEITTCGTVLTLGSGFFNPVSVAVDKAGNVYVADNGYGIKKIPAGNGTPVTIAPSTYNNATAVAVDGYGNVFFTMGGVNEILASNGTIKQYNYSGLNNAASIAVDANGNIFYSAQLISNNTRAVYEIPAGDIVSTPLNFGTLANTDNIYLAVNTAGVLYLSDPVSGIITKSVSGGGYFINAALPAGLSINTNTGVISGTPTATSAATAYTVTGYNNSGAGVGTVNIKTVAGTNTSLTNLAVSSGTLSPAFATATTGYSVSEPYATSSITITPTAGDGAAVIKVNGVTVVSGTASTPIPLAVGTNIIGVSVTDNGGTTASNYTITVNRTGNASLANFAISAGTLSPAFASGTYSYSVTMPAGVSGIVITPTLADTTGTITINGKAIATGTPSPNILLAVGANTITTVTSAADGITTQTYTLTATRQSANAFLGSLHLSAGVITPTFSPATNNYSANVNTTITSITVTPGTSDANATVTVNGTAVASGSASGPIALALGANTITIVVTAPDGATTKTYTLTVNRVSSNANLSALTLSQGTLSPAFASGTLSYTVSVTNTVTSLTVTPSTADAGATVKVNGTAVASGSASGSIALTVGANTVTVVVIAGDGTTTKTYTVAVNRAASSNADLSSLTFSQGAISPAFASSTISYTTSVANNITTSSVTPYVSDAGATVKVNGTTVASGSASGSIALAVGANTITILVTAQDGTSTKTYTLTVTRQSQTSANLSALTLSNGTLSPVFASATTSYSASVVNGVSSITVTPSAADPSAQIKVNGAVVTSGTASGAIDLAVGSNTISIVFTPSVGIGTVTYTITVTRTSGPINIPDESLSVNQQPVSRPIQSDGIVVHQGISPNGDGINDFLTIENIANYPDNKLSIMNRNGQLIFEAKGYDNSSKVFDGHSNKTGQMQLPGTYFYSLDYTVNGITKHKTGYLVLKY